MLLNPDTVAGMARSFLVSRYSNPKPTPLFHYELWELCCSDYPKVAIAAPRAHAKTTAITKAWLLSMLLFRRRRHAVIISNTEGQASEFVVELGKECKDNPDIVKYFSVEKMLKDTGTEVSVQFADGHAFRVLGIGSEQEIRGRIWNGTRPDVIVCDDFENQEIVESDSRREKMRRTFFGSVLPSLSDDGIVRVVGTILHDDALLERLMPKENDPDTVIEPLRMYNMAHEWAAVKYRAHNEDFSQVLWPEKDSAITWKRRRGDYMGRGVLDLYSMEFLNEPVPDDVAFFDKRDFLELKVADKEKRLTWYASADLAISERDGAAFTVIVVGARDESGKIQVRDIRRGRWNARQIIDEIFTVQERYQPDIFWMEQENIQRSLGPIIQQEMLDRNVFINLDTVVPSKDKKSRAAPLQARMRAGAVQFDKDADWYFELEKEMRRFPKGQYKDQVDALALLAFGLNKMQQPSSQKEQADEDYRREFGSYYVGRNMTTGY